MAEYNYGQGYPLRNDFNYTGENDWYNYDNAPPTATGIQYPGGNPAYPRNEGLYQDRIMGMTNMPASNYITKKEEPGFLRKTWDKTKDLASQATGAPLGLLNLITQRQGATESFGGYPGSGFGSRAGLFPQEVANLQAVADQGLLRSGGKDAFGTNVVSQFGDYNKHMAERKQLFTDKLGEGETLKDLYDSYVAKYGKNSAIAKRLNHYANFGGATDASAADKISGAVTGTDRVGGDRITPSGVAVTTGGGGTFDPVLDQGPRYGGPTGDRPSWRGATAAREALSRSTGGAQGQVAGPGFGQGAYWAEGGRVGYQDGELVEDEYMAEATPGGMMEENIEEVQGEPTREQLEAIALEIFRLPLEQLNEQQLEVVYQAAMEQEPSEEEVQFAAQEGPGEGIASLV